jgi:hypothetical protein
MANIFETLAQSDEVLSKKILTKQYALSKQIIKQTVRLGIGQLEIARRLDISFADYLMMESGSNQFEISLYEDVLEKISSIEYNSSEEISSLEASFCVDEYSTNLDGYSFNTYKSPEKRAA